MPVAALCGFPLGPLGQNPGLSEETQRSRDRAGKGRDVGRGTGALQAGSWASTASLRSEEEHPQVRKSFKRRWSLLGDPEPGRSGGQQGLTSLPPPSQVSASPRPTYLSPACARGNTGGHEIVMS